MASMSDTMPPRSVATQAMWGYAKASASALVLGAAFGGGLLFGAADDDDAQPAQPALAAADASTDKLEAVQQKLRLAFHKELTGAPRDKPHGTPVTPTDIVHTAAAHAVPAASPVPEAEEASSGTEPPESAPKAAAPAIAAATQDDADDQAPANAEELEELMATPPKAETEADRTRVARAIARVLGDDAAPSAPDVVEKAKQIAAAEQPRYAVQIASTPSEEGAAALVEKLRGQGHEARISKVDLPEKGAMFRVRIGGFTSRDAASAYREKLGEGFVIGE